jgi:metal-responsive CopG/Arc/MetJ family transcriptional regulator
MVEQTISVRIEANVLKELNRFEKRMCAGRSEIIRRLLLEAIANVKMKNALEDLKTGKISIGKAAQEADMNVWEMVDLAKKNDIDWVGYDEEELEKDLLLIK